MVYYALSLSPSVVSKSCPTLATLHGLLCPWDSPGKNTGVDCHFLLQGIFPTQESNPGLLYCRQILYRLSYEGSPIMCYYYVISGNVRFSDSWTTGEQKNSWILPELRSHGSPHQQASIKTVWLHFVCFFSPFDYQPLANLLVRVALFSSHSRESVLAQLGHWYLGRIFMPSHIWAVD